MKILNFEFLKDRYEFELDRKEKLTAALTLPVGILTGLGGLLAVMARSFTYRDTLLTWLFAPFMVTAVLAFFVCLLFLARAYHAQTYIYLPLLADLEAADEEFREFNNYVRSSGGEVEETFASDLRERIIKAADQNTENNERRSKFLHWARVALFCVLGLTALAGIPYVADQVRFFMPTQQAPKPTQTQPASAPQKPSFPENRVIKEGRDPQTTAKK